MKNKAHRRFYRVIEDARFPRTREVYYSVAYYGHYAEGEIVARCFNRSMARRITALLNAADFLRHQREAK